MKRMRRRAAVLAPVLFCVSGTLSFWNAAPVRASVGASPSVAPAKVFFLDARGHRITRTPAKHTIQFVLSFHMPRSFPSGYSDVRFTVFVHGKPNRTIIFGTPKHLLPGKSVRIALLVPVSRTWAGRARVVGTVTLLAKPGGVSLHRMGRGVAILKVTP